MGSKFFDWRRVCAAGHRVCGGKWWESRLVTQAWLLQPQQLKGRLTRRIHLLTKSIRVLLSSRNFGVLDLNALRAFKKEWEISHLKKRPAFDKKREHCYDDIQQTFEQLCSAWGGGKTEVKTKGYLYCTHQLLCLGLPPASYWPWGEKTRVLGGFSHLWNAYVGSMRFPLALTTCMSEGQDQVSQGAQIKERSNNQIWPWGIQLTETDGKSPGILDIPPHPPQQQCRKSSPLSSADSMEPFP